MQTKKWSSEDLKEQFEGCLDLGEVISRLESDFLKDGEVICGIRVNGMFLTQEDELKFSVRRLKPPKHEDSKIDHPLPALVSG